MPSISKGARASSGGAEAPSSSPYRFFIDEKAYQSSQRLITGEQIRSMGRIEPEYRIFFEKHREENEKDGHPSDREILNNSSVDLAEPDDEKFYTLHRPTMDIN